jgi:hypothetical protein
LISEKSMVYADAAIDDYDDRRAAQEAWWEGQAGQQPGDPAKLAQALLRITDEQPPPRRFIAGADVIALAERKADEFASASRRLPRPVHVDGPRRLKRLHGLRELAIAQVRAEQGAPGHVRRRAGA